MSLACEFCVSRKQARCSRTEPEKHYKETSVLNGPRVQSTLFSTFNIGHLNLKITKFKDAYLLKYIIRFFFSNCRLWPLITIICDAEHHIFNCGERYEDINDPRSSIHNVSICEINPEKNSGLNGIRTYDLCDTGAVLSQLIYQVNWSSADNVFSS